MLSVYIQPALLISITGLTAPLSDTQEQLLSFSRTTANAWRRSSYCGRPWMRKLRRSRRNAMPKLSLKIMLFPVILLCFVLCHFCYPISPDQDHKPRGRASDVSTISTCFFLYVMIYCPLPHQSPWESLGYHCCVLVRLLALYAKLNWFFPKKSKVVYPISSTAE